MRPAHWPVSFAAIALIGCTMHTAPSVLLSEGVDNSAGGDPAYHHHTKRHLLSGKNGRRLSSMLDRDGIDWLGFHKAPGSGHKGEYRGFPNAVHKQDGNYFHAMNAKTDPSTTRVEKRSPDHIRIAVTSENGNGKGNMTSTLTGWISPCAPSARAINIGCNMKACPAAQWMIGFLV